MCVCVYESVCVCVCVCDRVKFKMKELLQQTWNLLIHLDVSILSDNTNTNKYYVHVINAKCVENMKRSDALYKLCVYVCVCGVCVDQCLRLHIKIRWGRFMILLNINNH